MGALRHPNVVGLEDIVYQAPSQMDGGKIYLILELAAGFARPLRFCPLPPPPPPQSLPPPPPRPHASPHLPHRHR